MKVLQVNDYCFPLGGAERYMLDVCKSLEESGHQVVLLSRPPLEGRLVPPWKTYSIKESSGIRSGRSALQEVIKIIEKEAPDVVHLHNVWRFLSPLVVSAIHRLKPTVRFLHDVRSLCPNETKVIPVADRICDQPAGWGCFRGRCRSALLRREGNNLRQNVLWSLIALWELRVTRQLDRIIIGSRYMQKELLRSGFPEERVVLIPCYRIGIPQEEMSPPPAGKERIVLCVGRLDGCKGIDQLIRALARIREKAWQAEVVGDGPQAEAFSRLAEELGLGERVRFWGRVPGDALADYYQRAALIVVPSRIPESFGLVGLEAMSYGRPVVAFDVGGVGEWLADGVTGFLVEHGDLEGMARRIGQVLEDPGLALRLGLAGKGRVESLFRRQAHIGRLVQVYEEALHERALGEKR